MTGKGVLAGVGVLVGIGVGVPGGNSVGVATGVSVGLAVVAPVGSCAAVGILVGVLVGSGVDTLAASIGAEAVGVGNVGMLVGEEGIATASAGSEADSSSAPPPPSPPIKTKNPAAGTAMRTAAAAARIAGVAIRFPCRFLGPVFGVVAGPRVGLPISRSLCASGPEVVERLSSRRLPGSWLGDVVMRRLASISGIELART